MVKSKNFKKEKGFNKFELRKKKLVKTPKTELNNKIDNEKINKQLKKKNSIIELNSRLKKKILKTKNSLKLKEDVIDSAINFIKKENSEISEKLNHKIFGNFYAYIVLKNKITEEIDSFEKQEFDKKQKNFLNSKQKKMKMHRFKFL